MERAGRKTRDIQFFSEKNGRMVCLHSPAARMRSVPSWWMVSALFMTVSRLPALCSRWDG